MSIHPIYANAIMAGDKMVEFRKRPLAADVEIVWVYATAPMQRIVGYFRIATTEVASPKQLWSNHSRVGCISREDFDRYYSGHDVGVAIGIACAFTLPVPKPLGAILPSGIPPQSFVYLPPVDTDCALTGLITV